MKKNGRWEEAPKVTEDDGFNLAAMKIKAGDTVEEKLDWKGLYGELEPGEYRIGKSVDDFVKSGRFDEYKVYAHFALKEG